MVRVGFPGGPRLEWYDRNPIDRGINYLGEGIAPHTSTVRATFTVPTGKKAFVANASAQVVRYTAATAVGRANISVGPASAPQIWLEHFNNTVGAEVHDAIGQSVMLLAGDALFITTTDLSTAGTMDYLGTAHIVEFSA